MTRPIRLVVFAFLLLVALAAAALPFVLPPRAVATPAPHWNPASATARGAYHVHSTASDGSGSLDEIASAAARAGLDFVVLTDHGDAIRRSEPPRYRSGVLVIEAVEINTTGGHLVALGAAPAPYPLAGTPDAVLEDVHRLGGTGIAAHPGSPRESLQWTAWEAAIDGIEWLNADSEWRDELVESLGRLMLTYAFRPAETLASMLDRPDAVLERWDQALGQRRLAVLAGSDAHARLGFREQSASAEERWGIELPGYESAFRAFSMEVVLDAPLSGDPVRDAADVVNKLRWGRSYSVVDGRATPGAFDLTAASGGTIARMGDYLDPNGPVTLHARMAAPPGTTMVLLRDGEPMFDTRESEIHLNVLSAPGAYRVEAYLPGDRDASPLPWILSNPIYVGLRDAHARRSSAVRAMGERHGVAIDVSEAEVSVGSSSRLQPNVVVDGVAAQEWQFGLAGGPVSGQFAALRLPVGAGLAGRVALELRARADEPMRAWIQLRASAGGAGERWGKTIYLDRQFRGVDVFFEDLAPLGVTSTPRPALDKVDALLLVVDTLNTRPGTAGRVQIAETWLR